MTMTRMTAAFGALLAGGICATLVAQSAPDFSGRWTSDPEPAAAAVTGGQRGARGGGGRGGAPAGNMGSGWGSPITITQDAGTLVVEYVFFGRGDLQPPLRFTYALDGTETTNEVTMGRGVQRQTSKAAWDGRTLVITTSHPFTNPDTGASMVSQVVRRLTLESPASLVVDTTRPGVMGGPASSAKTVYRKLESGGR